MVRRQARNAISAFMKQSMAAGLLLVLSSGCATPTMSFDDIPSLSYCELRRQEHNYMGDLVRVRALWRYRSGSFSYIHLEPHCEGRSGFGLLSRAPLCPQMRSLSINWKSDFEADIVGIGSLPTHERMGADQADGTVFAAVCIEELKQRPRP